MKNSTRSILITSISLFLIDSVSTQGTTGEMDPSAYKFASSVFEDKCAMCHEEDGKSDDERLNLVDKVWTHGGTFEEIARTIRDGVPDTDMKAHGPIYGDDHVAHLAQYVMLLGERFRHGLTGMMQPDAGPAGMNEPVAGEPGITPDVTLPPLSDLVSLRLHPESPTLWGPDASQRFVVLGTFVDGLERDLSTVCEFSINDPQIASIESGGRIQALADGNTLLSVEVAGLQIKTDIAIEGTGTTRPFSFARDIAGILTKQGCNAADCHGGVKGRGGLKLSINALYPADDYEWIVQGGIYQVLSPEPKGGERTPRINSEDPEKSLLLLKPTYQVDHEGGKRFSVDSEDHATIVEWIRNGARYEEGDAAQVQIKRLEVFPKEAVLDQQGKHQLVVTALLPNGRREDVTDQVNFATQNKEVVRVSRDGLVAAMGIGETDIVIRASGQVASARFGVINKTIPDYPQLSSHNFIDDHIFAKLKKFHIIQSDLSSDSEFLRRLCLDMTGTLPPPNRVREFLADEDPDKRGKLIEILLESPEYEDYWTFRFCELFRLGPQFPLAESQLYWAWIREGIVKNKPYDQIARERIDAVGYSPGPSRFKSSLDKTSRLEKLMGEELRVFMGRRLECAQCHNHPFDPWSQDQFWGMTAFYARSTTADMERVIYDDPEGQEFDWGQDGIEDLRFIKAINPRTKQEIPPTYLDGKVLEEDLRDDPRRALATWLTSHPYFAEAIVNRMWSYFFGRGIVDPVDDFKLTNLPTHPELLAALAKDFRENGHDLKHLVRLITNSKTYQLSSIPNETNAHDTLNYSRSLPRPLGPEELLDSISATAGVPFDFEHTSGGVKPHGSRAIQLRYPATWKSNFLDVHGRHFRRELMDRDPQPNLRQALHQLVGDTFTDQLSKQSGRLDELMERRASNQEVIEELYLAALSRYPTQEELTELDTLIHRRSPILEQSFFQNSTRREVFEDLLWALLNTREFVYNL